MAGHPTRHPREAFDLTVRAVALQRGGAGPAALVAALDQARASLAVEPVPVVARCLTWVCGALDHTVPEEHNDEIVVDAALRVAARGLGSVPSDGPA